MPWDIRPSHWMPLELWQLWAAHVGQRGWLKSPTPAPQDLRIRATDDMCRHTTRAHHTTSRFFFWRPLGIPKDNDSMTFNDHEGPIQCLLFPVMYLYQFSSSQPQSHHLIDSPSFLAPGITGDHREYWDLHGFTELVDAWIVQGAQISTGLFSIICSAQETSDLLNVFLNLPRKACDSRFAAIGVARHGASTWRFTFSRPLQIAAHVTQEFLCEHHLPFESIWFMSVVPCEGSASCGGMAVILTRTSVAHINWKVHCFSHIFRFLVKSSRHAGLIIQDFYIFLLFVEVPSRIWQSSTNFGSLWFFFVARIVLLHMLWWRISRVVFVFDRLWPNKVACQWDRAPLEVLAYSIYIVN